MTHNRFAVVRDWEDTVSAEEECLRRLQLSADDLGVVCDIVDTSYRLINDRSKTISSESHDFVLHLHYCSGKAENVFSFVPLWNPIDFFHKWGYRTSADTLLTNDDFLQSTSLEAILHVERLTADSTYHLGDFFTLYPAPSKIYCNNTSLQTRKRRLMYCGINWERLDSKKGRFSSLLKRLDDENLIDIYGPEVFHGIRPWKGYKNYRGEIPFDGLAMIDTISRSGIGLVISSDSHYKDEVVSNRLFETLAAGAIVISDNNSGVRKLLGDSCLYIDTSDLNLAYQQIKDHLSWIENSPDLVSQMLSNNRNLFVSKLAARSSLDYIYSNLEKRKNAIHKFRQPVHAFELSCFYLLDKNSPYSLNEQISTIIKSVKANFNSQIKNYFLCDSSLASDNFTELEAYGKVIRDEFFYKDQNLVGRKLIEILTQFAVQYFSIILPGEELFSDHFISIIKIMQLKGVDAGSSDFILRKSLHGAVNYIGARWSLICLEHWTGGNFVFDRSLLYKDNCYLFLRPLSYAFSNFLASYAQSIASSGGFSCKIHHLHEKNKREVDEISDCRNLKTKSLVTISSYKNDSYKPSLVRKIYEKNFSVIVKLKKYPLFWEVLKKIFKPFM